MDSMGDSTTIPIDSDVRDRLRRYKAQEGLTYSEAIAELLDQVGWEADE